MISSTIEAFAIPILLASFGLSLVIAFFILRAIGRSNSAKAAAKAVDKVAPRGASVIDQPQDTAAGPRPR